MIGYTEDSEIRYFALRKGKESLSRMLFEAYEKRCEKENAARIAAWAVSSEIPFFESLGFEILQREGIYVLLEFLLQTGWLGKTVTVTVDRPYGSFHPHYPDIQYPCNYGYVEEVFAKDGEFQDAYVIGVEEPVETISGKVIAIIYRRDDIESKWVIATRSTWSRQEVIDTVGFIEQYFETRILFWNEKPMA